MARQHAKLLAAIWSDPDFLALPSSAQRLYMLLLSQPKLSIVGCLDYMPARWARLAPDTTTADIERDAWLLHEHQFVVIDSLTDELVIRTLVKHDGVRATANSNLLKGFWSAWATVESAALRKVLTDQVPDEVWEAKKWPPPPDALSMRRSDPPEPPVPTAGSNRNGEVVPTAGSNHGSEPRGRAPSTFHLPPSGIRSSQSAVTATGADPEAVDDDGRSAAPPSERIAAVARLVGQRDHEQALAADVPIPKPRGHLRKCIRNRQRDAALIDLVTQYPNLPDQAIADLVPPWHDADQSHLAPVPPPTPAADPDCPLCEGSGSYFVSVDSDAAAECDCKFRSAS